ncbi:hypothetical protein K7432_017769 [Basidiobolus ranarum]|uniref:Uncharacterized protein n=1 Tax=Basidiobolus ranarum TaxID=34480 RepID=A0ABR2VK57_9FUNG
MRCVLLLAEAEGDKAEYDALSSFTDTFCATYRETSNLRRQKRPDDVHMQLLRPTFIIHGREMINRAHDTYNPSPYSKDMVDLSCDNVEEFFDDLNWVRLSAADGRNFRLT